GDPICVDPNTRGASGQRTVGCRTHHPHDRLDPEPWDAGAVAAILPDLAKACENVDWSKPLADWPRDTVIEFLLAAMPLIRKAMIARDLSERGVTQRSGAAAVERQGNSTTDGSPIAPDELNDEISI